MPLDVEQPGQL
ncbi:hypothetical protein MKD33_18125, partial [Chromobacterium piscinae]